MVVLHAVPDLPLRDRDLSAVLSPGLVDRVLASKAQARRRWAARTGLLLSLTGVLLLILFIWQRDVVTIRDLTWSAEQSCRAIQGNLNDVGLLPAALPAAKPYNFAYLSYADRFYAQHVSHPVIVAVSPEVPLKLHSNGRSVIILDNGRVHVEWMAAGDFAKAWLAQTADAEQFEQQRRVRAVELP
jgi:hypothetical protein